MSYGTDPMGAALDNWITGNWGEDQFAAEDPRCEECAADNLADDPDWKCPYDGDSMTCAADEAADRAEGMVDR